MDTNLIKTVSMYVGAALVGGGIGYIVADRVLKAKDDYDWQRESWSEEPNKFDASPDLTSEEVLISQGLSRDADGTIHSSGEFVVTNEKVLKRPKAKMTTVDYAGITKKPLTEVVKEHLGGDTIEPGENDATSPHIISLEQYNLSAEAGMNDQVPLVYYEDDDVLVFAENEVPIQDPENMVGDALSHFGKGSEDPDIVYVRDPIRLRDIEISRVHNSYNEVVLGKPKEEPKKESRRTRKARKVENANEGEEPEE